MSDFPPSDQFRANVHGVVQIVLSPERSITDQPATEDEAYEALDTEDRADPLDENKSSFELRAFGELEEEPIGVPYLQGLPQLSDELRKLAYSRRIGPEDAHRVSTEIQRIAQLIREARETWKQAETFEPVCR